MKPTMSKVPLLSACIFVFGLLFAACALPVAPPPQDTGAADAAAEAESAPTEAPAEEAAESSSDVGSDSAESSEASSNAATFTIIPDQ